MSNVDELLPSVFTAFNLGSARHFFEEAAALRLIERGAVKPGILTWTAQNLGKSWQN